MVNAKKLSMAIATAVLSTVSLDLKPVNALHPINSTPFGEPSEAKHEHPPGHEHALVVTPDTPRPVYDILGDRFRFLSLGSETNNKFAAFEVTAPVGQGVPQHIHDIEAEVFYLQDGQLTLNLGGQTQVVEAGTYAYLPKGRDHGFLSTGTTPAKILALAYPGGFTDGLTLEAGTRVTDPNTPILPPIKVEQAKKTALDYTLNFFPETFQQYEGNETYHVVPPGAPDRPVYEALGAKYTVLDTLEQTSGQFSFLDVLLPPQAQVQIDEQQEHQLYVLDGQVQFQVGDQTTVGTPGSYVYLPKNTPYSFQNLQTTSARALLISNPVQAKTSVPEPSFLLGTLAFAGYCSVSLMLKHKQKKQKLVNLEWSTCLSQR
jgi:quercetin dioxygenase-like cupin family protein